MTLGVRLCVSAEPRLHASLVSAGLGGEGIAQ